VRGLALALGLLAAAAAAGTLIEGGCATGEAANYQPRTALEPDGGWASYTPKTSSGPTYQPNPAVSASGGIAPQMNPVTPVFPTY
jgi:hypothetical protein